MSIIKSILGRRQFFAAMMRSAIVLAFGNIPKLFGGFTKKAIAMPNEKTENKKQLRGIVVYYSATGSTAKIANAIYKGMSSVIECDVAPIKKMKPEDMGKYDVMALGAPIWFYREPANIKLFTNHMPRMDGKYCALFTTHGTEPYSIFWNMSRNVLKKGMTIIGWNDWYGDTTHVLHMKMPYITHGHPDRIDLKEAEAFGREMAERALRIEAGEKSLIPEIPTPKGSENHLWSPNVIEDEITFGLPGESPPEFDLAKCVYPRCTECMDQCPLNAIDIPLATRKGLADSPIVLKEGCQTCGGLCERVCRYDAITYGGEKTQHAIDMTKCTYPKCTLCLDECLMDCIDFSHNPPVFHSTCEGCDVCWCICPTGAISITNLQDSHLRHAPISDLPEEVVKKYNLKETQSSMDMMMMKLGGPDGEGMPGGPGGPGAGGPMGEMGEGGGMMAGPRKMPKFRQLIPTEETGVLGHRMFDTNIPRIVLNKEDWPYHMDDNVN